VIPRIKGRRTLGGLAALVAISLAAAACGAAPGTQDQTTTASSPPVEVFFPKQTEPVRFGYDEALSGELVRDGEGCLRVRYQGGAVVPLWPPDLEPSVKGDEVRVLDGEGRTVGQVGAKIDMGGGGIREDALTEDILDRRTKRELLERCPGGYFLVQEGTVRVPRQG
jgi:hypothetical protein